VGEVYVGRPVMNLTSAVVSHETPAMPVIAVTTGRIQEPATAGHAASSCPLPSTRTESTDQEHAGGRAPSRLYELWSFEP
jgi:hypothetical protein